MADLPYPDLLYRMVDADRHYYEPDDFFSRCTDPNFRDRIVELISVTRANVRVRSSGAM